MGISSLLIENNRQKENGQSFQVIETERDYFVNRGRPCSLRRFLSRRFAISLVIRELKDKRF